MPKQTLAFVGTYTNDNASLGIYVHRYDAATGTLTFLANAPKVDSPSFLATARGGSLLYAVIENTDGEIASFKVDRSTGTCKLLGKQSTHGAHPCHLAVDPTEKWVIVANYSSGNVAVFPIEADGALGAATDVLQQKGTGPDTARQEGPHAHSVTFDPSGKWIVVGDLGADKCFVYTLDTARGKLIPARTPAITLKPGTGPRHFAFHPKGRFAYAIGELGNTVTAFSFDPKRGEFAEIQTIATVPDGWAGKSFCADIEVHPTGRFLYGSNRGHDSIAMFAIDERSGRLTSLGQEPVRGQWPRNFAISPDGRHLLVGDQNTNGVVAFAIDPARGRLTATGKQWAIPAPVCILFQE